MVTIRDIMSSQPISIRPETPVKEALEILIENDISGVPVVDEAGQIEGVLSEKDLLKLFYEPEASTVASVMTRDPVTLDVNAPLVEVFDCLMAHDFRRVLIRDESKKLVGLVSRADLMPTILQTLARKAG